MRHELSPAISQISVEVDSSAKPRADKRAVTVSIILPPGTFFKDCPHPACQLTPRKITAWNKYNKLKYVSGTGWTTTADFLVKADRFGVAVNDVNASASIPTSHMKVPGNPPS